MKTIKDTTLKKNAVINHKKSIKKNPKRKSKRKKRSKRRYNYKDGGTFTLRKDLIVSWELSQLRLDKESEGIQVKHISPAWLKRGPTERLLSVGESNQGKKIIIWRDVDAPNPKKGYSILKISSPLVVPNDDNTDQYWFDFQKHNLKLTIPDGHPNSTGVHIFTFNNREEFINFVSMFVSILNELDKGLQMTVQKKMIEDISKELSFNNEQEVYFIKLLSMYTKSKSDIMSIQQSNTDSFSSLNEKLTYSKDDFYKSEFAWIDFFYQYFFNLKMKQDEVYESMESYFFREGILTAGNEWENPTIESPTVPRLGNRNRNGEFAKTYFSDANGLSWIIISKQIQNIFDLSSISEKIQPKNELMIKMGTYDDAEERKESYTNKDLGTDPNLSVLKANETDLFLIITDRNYILKITAKLLLLVAMEGYVPFIIKNSGKKFLIEECGLPEYRLEIFKGFMKNYLDGKFDSWLTES